MIQDWSVHFWSCFYQIFHNRTKYRIWKPGSLPIEKLFSCQSLVHFGLTYITLEVTIIRNTSYDCPRRGLYLIIYEFTILQINRTPISLSGEIFRTLRSSPPIFGKYGVVIDKKKVENYGVIFCSLASPWISNLY